MPLCLTGSHHAEPCTADSDNHSADPAQVYPTPHQPPQLTRNADPPPKIVKCLPLVVGPSKPTCGNWEPLIFSVPLRLCQSLRQVIQNQNQNLGGCGRMACSPWSPPPPWRAAWRRASLPALCSVGAVWQPRAPGAVWLAADGSVWWGGGGGCQCAAPPSGAQPGGPGGGGRGVALPRSVALPPPGGHPSGPIQRCPVPGGLCCHTAPACVSVPPPRCGPRGALARRRSMGPVAPLPGCRGPLTGGDLPWPGGGWGGAAVPLAGLQPSVGWEEGRVEGGRGGGLISGGSGRGGLTISAPGGQPLSGGGGGAHSSPALAWALARALTHGPPPPRLAAWDRRGGEWGVGRRWAWRSWLAVSG